MFLTAMLGHAGFRQRGLRTVALASEAFQTKENLLTPDMQSVNKDFPSLCSVPDTALSREGSAQSRMDPGPL